MRVKKKLLIINKHQLGALTDVYKWCYYLRDDYDITLLCFDTGIERVLIDGIHVKYVNYEGILVLRGIRFVLYCLWNILWFSGKILVVYFEHCGVFKRIFPLKKMIVDVRTLSISPDPQVRKKADRALIKTCRHYDAVSVISEGVKQKIGDIGRPIYILPLGADCISHAKKDYSSLRLLYVGTFRGRDLDKTVRGVALFVNKYPDVSLTYDIIGSGSKAEDEQLRTLVVSMGLNERVKFHGRIENHLLAPYFDNANIGVSFVPITDYYNVQPPTKTFEYVLSGLFTIATATDENRKIISADNGILIEDTEFAFAKALEDILMERVKINEQKVRESLKNSSWKNIVDLNLRYILNNI